MKDEDNNSNTHAGGHGGVILPMFFDIDPDESKLILTGRPDKRYHFCFCLLLSLSFFCISFFSFVLFLLQMS